MCFTLRWATRLNTPVATLVDNDLLRKSNKQWYFLHDKKRLHPKKITNTRIATCYRHRHRHRHLCRHHRRGRHRAENNEEDDAEQRNGTREEECATRGVSEQLAAACLNGALRPRCLRHQCQVLQRPRGRTCEFLPLSAISLRLCGCATASVSRCPDDDAQ